jgi:hypothetical protein
MGFSFKNLWIEFKQLFNQMPSIEIPPVIKNDTIVPTKPTVADVIYAYNKAYVRPYPLLGGKDIDAEIFRISQLEAERVAKLIQDNATRTKLRLEYLMACICQESMFSEKCFNNNMKEHDGKVNFEGTDWGLCQMAGKYLPDKPGMKGLSEDKMAALACTAEWAVPVMSDIMASNITQSMKAIVADQSLADAVKKLNTTKLSDVEWLATLSYNRGFNGAVKYVKSNNTAMIRHPYHVADYNDAFITALENGFGKNVELDIKPFGKHKKR